MNKLFIVFYGILSLFFLFQLYMIFMEKKLLIWTKDKIINLNKIENKDIKIKYSIFYLIGGIFLVLEFFYYLDSNTSSIYIMDFTSIGFVFLLLYSKLVLEKEGDEV